jgi:acetyl-CoA carboxylase biotin carboxyl carrier protein
MTIEEITQLIRLVRESGIAELEVQRGDSRVRIRGVNSGGTQEVLMPAPAASVTSNPVTPQSAVTAGATTSAPQPAEDEANLTYVRSPIVGTYYDAPSPGAPPFVNVGDRVRQGQVLCIIESMKLMNEIESEVSGVVVRKLVENGQPVEYGEALFAIRPA